MSRWLGWVAIAVLVLAAGLALASFGQPNGTPSVTQQTRQVAGQLRCPVCQGESVADSPSGLAASMRALIARKLEQGQTPEQIKSFFVSRYGQDILLSPGSGIAAVLPSLSLLLMGLAIVVLALAIGMTSGRRGDWPSPKGRRALGAVRGEFAANNE